MYHMSDEELFGMIPKRDGTFDVGNATEEHLSFGEAYVSALKHDNIFPSSIVTSITYAPGWDEEEEVEKKRENALWLELQKEYGVAYFKVDQAIEEHLDKTNGYIGCFPPSQMPVFSDSKRCEYDYFHYMSKDHRPPMEKRLREAYANAHQEFDGMATFLFWAVMSALVFALVLFRDQIYGTFPQLVDWMSASKMNGNIYYIGITGFMIIVDWIIMARLLEVDFGEHLLVHVVMIVVIFFWGSIYFNPDIASEDGFFRILLEIVFFWPVRIYCGLVCLTLVASVVQGVVGLRKYRKNLSRYQETYVQVWEEDFNKLNRYLRLRELWLSYENRYTPEWMKNLSQRVYEYRVEYESICRNRI